MFQDRTDAGRLLAAALTTTDRVRLGAHPIVLALPRGGVPVAVPVADALAAPLDVLVVRKLGAPQNPEFALGAIGQDSAQVLDRGLVQRMGMTQADVDRLVATERAELERRVAAYRGGRPPLDLAGRSVVIVDDGLATGSTAAAAVAVARHLGAAHVTLAVPVGSPEAVAWLRSLADDVVCLTAPEAFRAVGEHYADFRQVSDAEVVAALRTVIDADVIVGPGVGLPGHLTIPAEASGVVVFAHGSGSSRHSPRNVHVARHLQAHGLGTLLLDLLTPREATDRSRVFDIPLLATRVEDALEWTAAAPECAGLPVGLFGASTGAAAALVAAAERPQLVSAVVSRGGRPDLAARRLAEVRAPTLLIVGGHDDEVLALNRAASREFTCPHDVAVVPGATHLFEEPGALDDVADLAAAWFGQYLRECA